VFRARRVACPALAALILCELETFVRRHGATRREILRHLLRDLAIVVERCKMDTLWPWDGSTAMTKDNFVQYHRSA